jgi:general secretion pathway protein E
MQLHNTLHNPHLDAFEPEGVDLDIAVKNYVLYTQIDDETVIALSQQYLHSASNYISKLDQEYRVVLLDEDSYERLYNKFLELRTDKTIENMQEERDEDVEEEELSLTEFLRTSSDILTSEESAPIIKFVNALFYQAIKRGASDIHIEVHEHKGEVRFRIDGVLTKNADLDRNIVQLIISRIKVISNLDISEKRVPQDGRTQVKVSGKTLDIRVSVLPTYYGERVVMRILMQSEDIPHMEDLGFDDALIGQFRKLLDHSHGIILVTGPTGSGKSTTLHAFLQEIARPEQNVITVEDPVEYKADNINQIQVNEKVGLTFASALRSILRQDPDTIMIGEIRDEETAQIAVRSALTGHLVLSTLHTNSAAATITRLDDMGIEPFLLSSSILGVLAQRLVRKLCFECKEEDHEVDALKNEYGINPHATLYKSNGCKACNYTGYNGRQSIGELLMMDDGLKRLLKTDTNEHAIAEYAASQGFVSLRDQLKVLLENGTTSLSEAIRVGLKE